MKFQMQSKIYYSTLRYPSQKDFSFRGGGWMGRHSIVQGEVPLSSCDAGVATEREVNPLQSGGRS